MLSLLGPGTIEPAMLGLLLGIVLAFAMLWLLLPKNREFAWLTGMSFALGLELVLSSGSRGQTDGILACSFIFLYTRALFPRRAAGTLLPACAAIFFAAGLLAAVFARPGITAALLFALAATMILCAALILSRVRMEGEALPWVFCGGLCVLALAALNDALSTLGFIASKPLMHFALALFLASQAALYILRFTRLIDLERSIAAEFRAAPPGPALGAGAGAGAGAGESQLASRVKKIIGEAQEKNAFLVAQSRQAALGNLVSHLTHQWRQPLNVFGLIFQTIQSNSELGILDKESATALCEQGFEEIKHLDDLLKDYRSYFKPVREERDFDICESLITVLRLQSPAIDSLKVQVSVDCPEGGIAYHGVQSALNETLANLVANALDAFTARKTASPSLGVGAELGADGWISIQIRDNAGGISEQIQQTIFDPYFTTKASGMGIGLYVAKLLIERTFGGRIAVVNEAQGACFTINLAPRSRE